MPALQGIDLQVAHYVRRGPLSKVASICSLFLCALSALDALKCKRGEGEPRCSCSDDAHLHMETSSTHSAGVAFIYSTGGLRECERKVCVLPGWEQLAGVPHFQGLQATLLCSPPHVPGGRRAWGTILGSRSTPFGRTRHRKTWGGTIAYSMRFLKRTKEIHSFKNLIE